MLLKIIELKSSLCLTTTVAQSVHGLGNVINHRQEMEYFSRLWKRSDLLWCPQSLLLFKRWREFVSQGKIGTGVKQIVYLHIVPRLRMGGAKLPLPIRLQRPHRNDFTFYTFTSFTNIDVS
jgi:hypothetical protein